MAVSDVSTLVQSIQRDINCLADPDRNLRKRSAEKLRREVLSDATKDPAARTRLFQELAKPLLRLFSDPVEKCRETSIETVQEFVESVADANEFLPLIIPVIVARIGTDPVQEQSEELRMMLVLLLDKIIAIAAERIEPYTADIVQILVQTIKDSFPDVKKQSCVAALRLSKDVPDVVGLHTAALVRALCTNMGHQQAKVRSSALDAIAAIVPCGVGTLVEDVMPLLRKALSDRQGGVREMNMLLLTKWLTELPGKQQYEAKLIPLLLAGLADEIPSVNQLAEKGMAAVGNACGRVCDAEDAADEGRMTELARSSKLVTARPVDGARALVRHHLSEMTAEVVQELKEWTLSARSLAAVKLTSLVVYSEASFASQMKSVLPALYQGCQDDEQEMAERMIRCTTVIGQYIAVDHYAPLLLSQVSGYRPDERGSCLRVLRYLLQSAIPTQLRPHLPSTLSMMTDPELLAAENPSVHIELMKLVHTVISTAGESCADVEADLFCVLIHLQSVQGDAALSAHAVQCIRDLAASVAASEVPALYERHLPGMLRKAVETHKQWTAASPERFLFDTLVRNAGVALGSQIDLVLTVMVQSTQPDRPAEIRLGLLALLLDMLSEPAVSAMLRPHAGRILGKVLLPNCQWQAGRVACAVRKAGVACCRALFVKDLCSFAHCVENMAELLPIWLTLLDDDSADVRLMMTECSESICRLFPNRLSDEHALKLYPELIKRLDDSNDGIRCAMCTTLCAFFDAVDEDYSRSTLEYIAKTLLIHLDDVNEAVQRAVLKPLQQLARLVPRAEFTALVQEAKQRHRETQYCDELLAMAT